MSTRLLLSRTRTFSRSLCTAALLCALPVADSVAQTLDSDIQNLVSGVEVARIGANIQSLANFGTRHTCSSNSATTTGIGAARNWIQSQFAAIPGLQVRIDPFTVTCSGTRRTRQGRGRAREL